MTSRSVPLLRWLGAVALAAATLSGVSAQPSRADPPLPADRLFAEWLDAFNSLDAARIKAFYGKHLADRDPAFALDMAQDSCGLTVERVEERSSTSMTVLLRERCLPGLQRVRVDLEPGGRGFKSLLLTPLALPGTGGIEATADIAGRLAARDEFAGSLIVTQGGRTVLARSWGLADPPRGRPMTLDTPMFLASAGKMFTAVAVLQLVDAGRIDLDAPLGRYLTGYPNPEMAKVTIRQLLTHRGGTGDIGILAREEGANRVRVRTIADILRLNGGRSPDFPPGSKTDYSNYGFVLLGAVVEKVSGRSYRDYVARHVFRPAGMRNSGFPDRKHLNGVAVGYTTFFGAEPKLVPNLDTLPWRGTPAGGGVASPNDMLRFFEAMSAGKLLSPAMLALATTAGPTPWYGMGFIVQAHEEPSRRSWGHGGISYGMDVAAHTYPHSGTTFICMAARDAVCTRLMYAWHLRTFGPDG